jgi:hypothetical protein
MMRRSLYWQEGGGEIRFGPRTWAEWQALGLEAGSLVAAPLFADADKGDSV